MPLPGVVGYPPEFAERYRAEGYWRGEVLGDLLRPWNQSDRIGVVDPQGTRWSYAELDRQADRFAAGLAGLGIRRGDRIVVQLPNIAAFVTVSVGCYRLGAIPVYGLPGHRRREICYLAEHSEAVGYVVADEYQGFSYTGLAREVQKEVSSVRHVIVVGEPAEFLGFDDVLAEPVSLPGPEPSAVAFFLLSGGTTGLPKLIPRTHDDYAYQLHATAAATGTDERGCYLASLPVAHNAALGCPGLLGTLAVGGKVVLPRNPSPDVVFDLLETERVTLTTLMPPMVQVWREAREFFDVDMSGLLIQVGSAHLSPDLAGSIMTEMGARLTHWFGMAEGLLTYTRLDDPDDVVIETQGRSLAAADEIKVVDDTDAEVARGEIGELLTRGPYTIRGYYRADDVNARAFTADGFLRTGDLVRITSDGNMVVEGRLKDVINKGGEKIVSAELEDVLGLHPAFRQVAVVGVPHELMGEVPCVFAVGEGRPPTLSEVRAFLTSHGVATYKLPDRVEMVAALPRTTVGKIDKQRLRADFVARAGDSG
ncbi:(2,3-dihydroxybenzoyl)adenylate synthase [Nonomuraea sp. NPDC050536]|uniref:(2,3-dihydroxybenzoyl)adenylate synthase n=1 Tax=Nonomuraea sp. NPDC050536 TaxID=3364366 RepID=UPI0037C907EF